VAISSEIHAKFCDQMKAWRAFLRMTQQEVADNLGVKQPVIAQLEKGDYVPSIETVADVATAMGITFDQIMSVRPPKPKGKILQKSA